MGSDLVPRAAAALERWSDRLNAVLVKEVRQALRSRRFIGAFMLALVAALLVTLGVLSAESSSGGLEPQAGKSVLYGLYVCLSVVATILVPFEAYSRFAADRAQASDDLIQITSLSATRILLGKLEAAGVTLLLYLSAMVPFSTFAYLLRGVTPTMIAVGFLMIVGAAFTAINVVLFLVALLPKKQGEAVALLCSIGAMIWLTSGGIIVMEEVARTYLLPREVWLAIGLIAAGAVPLNAVVFTCTAAKLSFASANKETAPRLALAAMNAFLAGTSLVLWWETGDEDAALVMSIIGLVWWGAAGFFVLAVEDEMSERVRNTFPRSSLVGFLLWPGRGRAFAFYLANVAVLAAPGLAAAAHGSRSDAMMMGFTVFYATFFPALPAAVFAFTRSRWRGPQNLLKATFVFLVIFFALQGVVEAFAHAYFSYGEYTSATFAPLHAVNPIVAVAFVASHRTREAQAACNVIVGGVLIVFVLSQFLPAVGRHLAESVTLAARRRRQGRAQQEPERPEGGAPRGSGRTSAGA